MIPQCPFCSSNRIQIITKEFRGADGKRAIVKCQNCLIKYLFPPKNEKEEKAFYDSNFQLKKIFGDNFDFDLYLKNIKEDTDRRVKFCQKFVSPNSFLLDVGCGYGYFVKRMKDLGYEAIGLDPSSERAEIGKEKFRIKIINNYLEDVSNNTLPDSIVDIITAFHTLEHIFNPDIILSSFYQKLKKGGKVIIEIPSGADYMLYFPKYAKFVYQEAHCLYYYPKHLRGILERNGFINVEIIPFQRYSLLNALNWLIKGKPQIKKPLRNTKNIIGLIDKLYKNIIQKFRISDTLIVVAEK